MDRNDVDSNPLFRKIQEEPLVSSKGRFIGENVEALLNDYLSQIRYSDGSYFTPNKIKLERVKIPHFKSLYEKQAWWREQYKRCKLGYDTPEGHICGSYYFYFNFCKIRDKVTGKPLPPKIRRIDIEYFTMCERMLFGDLRGDEQDMVNALGMYWLKRRQIGHTAKTHALMIWIGMFFENFTSMTTAVTEDLAIKLLSNQAKFIYKYIPDELKENLANSSEKEMVFGKWVKKEIVGTRGKIQVVTPNEVGAIGTANKMVFIDEIGETDNPTDFMNKLEPTLSGNEGMVRTGLLNIGGTAGDMGKMSNEAQKLWEDAASRDIARFFIAGWVGTNCDEYGNEINVTERVRYILQERKKRLHDKKRLYEYVRQFPLTPEEAFMASGESRFDIEKLTAMDYYLMSNNFQVPYQGYFERVAGQPIFRPSNTGKWLFLEHPVAGVEYLSGNDPYDKGKLTADIGSSGAMVIFKPQQNVQGAEIITELLKTKTDPIDQMRIRLKLGNLPIGIYVDDGRNPTLFYEQSALAAEYFNQSKILIENNRNNMIEWFKANNYIHLMKRKPRKTNSINPTTVAANEYGFYRDEEQKESDVLRLGNYVDNHASNIFFRLLLTSIMDYRPENKRKKNDLTDAFTAALYHLSISNPTGYAGESIDVWDMPRFTEKSNQNAIVSSRSLRGQVE